MFIFQSGRNAKNSDSAVFRKISFRLSAAIFITGLTLLAAGLFIGLCVHQFVAKTPAAIAVTFLAASLLLFFYSRLIANKLLAPMARNIELIRQFTQDAGHELATPLAVMRSRLQVLEHERQSEDIGQDIRSLSEAASRMSGLVDDLRVLARTQNAQKYLQLSILKLDTLVKSISEELKLQFQAKNMTVDLSELQPVSIIGDKEAIERVFTNLLTNAAKYGNDGCLVKVSISQNRNDVIAIVQDNGPGIPKDQLDTLFYRFYRAGRTQNDGGSGLGLAIVKAIIEAHNGTVKVSSEENKGTSFEIRLSKFPSQHPFALLARRESV